MGQQQLEMCRSDSQLIDPPEQILERMLNFQIKSLAEIGGHLSAILMDRMEFQNSSFNFPLEGFQAVQLRAN